MKKKMPLLLFFIFQLAVAQEPYFAWVKRFGTSSQQAYGPVAAIDNQGNSYITGFFMGSSFTLDGITLQSLSAVDNGYIAKYNSSGTLQWVKLTTGIFTVVGTNPPPNTNKIIVDNSGNVYLAGEYNSGQISKIGNHFLSSAVIPEQQAERNFFLAKLDVGGDVLWTKTTYRPYYYYVSGSTYNDIHFDLSGNITMTGYFREFITFSPEDTLTENIDNGAVFMVKYTPGGEIVLNRKLEGVVAQPFGAATGDTEQVIKSNTGDLYRWSNNQMGKTLYHYDPQGELLGSKTLSYTISSPSGNPNIGNLSLRGFAVDNSGNIYLGGHFTGQEIILEGTAFTRAGNTQTNADALLLKLNGSDFSISWIRHETFITTDNFLKLVTDALGDVYATGTESDPSENRLLVKKFDAQGNTVWQKIVSGLYSPNAALGGIHPSTICQSSDGSNIWITGTFRVNAYFNETAHYTTPGLNHFNGFLLQYGTCNTETPQITIPEITQICSGETIELTANFSNPELSSKWNTGQTTENITVDRAGIYYVIAQENEECYGKSQEIWITELAAPEVQVTFEGGSFNAAAENVTYQWIKCEGQTSLAGETGSTFTPSVAGSYQVEVTNMLGCAIVSNCMDITAEQLGLDTFEGHKLVVYPNPAGSIIHIKSEKDITAVTINNMLGQAVLKQNGAKDIDVSNLAAGNYVLKAVTYEGISTVKFIKK